MMKKWIYVYLVLQLASKQDVGTFFVFEEEQPDTPEGNCIAYLGEILFLAKVNFIFHIIFIRRQSFVTHFMFFISREDLRFP